MVVVLFLQSCGYFTTSRKYHIVIDDSIVGGIPVWKKYALIKKIEKDIDIVTQYFGITYTDTLTAYIFDNGRMEASRNRIYLHVGYLNNTHTILHEVTHGILGVKGSCFECEGVAVFVSDKFNPGQKLVYPDYVNRLKDQYFDAINNRGATIYPIRYLMVNDSLFRYEQALYAYMQAGLFYQFLEARFGRDKLIEYDKHGVCRIEAIYGMSIDSLDTLWRDWLWTKDEINSGSIKVKKYPPLGDKSGKGGSFLDLTSDGGKK